MIPAIGIIVYVCMATTLATSWVPEDERRRTGRGKGVMYQYRVAWGVHEQAFSLEDEHDIERLGGDVEEAVASGAARITTWK